MADSFQEEAFSNNRFENIPPRGRRALILQQASKPPEEQTLKLYTKIALFYSRLTFENFRTHITHKTSTNP